MRVDRLYVLTGTLALALWAAACNGGNGPGSGGQGDAGTDGGGTPTVDGGGTDAGGGGRDFACNVARQEGCADGQDCYFADLADGGTGSRCFEAECDVVAQDCAQGQRCTYAMENGVTQRRCVAPGTADEGAPCTLAPSDGGLAYDTCRQGLFCREAPDGAGSGFTCQRLCHATTQCGNASECNTVLRLEGTDELPLVCGPPSTACNPFGEDCDAPLSCYPSTSGPLCAGSGNRTEGQSCDFSNQCAPGSACVNAGGGLTCRPLCQPGGTPACSTGSCRALDSNPGVGACVP
ncbi:hypothetical protein [Myxococcus sp. NMCA1]|uniref:hypothetical protein n=1 Tax=Myxococcus sp. NMCA1 TaxID=2996785 RepID=UPI00228650DE|nr:hypothetical protein [Myxococcus sp. NMCA1]WAM23552.1 hypothetical protein OZ403_23625 [Myxococcus sp. NMCA1]